MSEKGKHLVFLYGTLKKQEPNHYELLDPMNGSATFIGNGRTVKKFPLIIASRYNIPFLLYNEGEGKHIIGEIYEADDKMLESLDKIECHPKYYERFAEEVIMTESSECTTPCKPWIYFMKNFRPHLLQLPFLEEYSSKGPHGLEYVLRCARPAGSPSYTIEVMND